jgi:hypothetical protein
MLRLGTSSGPGRAKPVHPASLALLAARFACFSAAVLAASCSDDTACLYEPLTRIEPLGPGTTCQFGGTVLHVGSDRNCNGTLDNVEVVQTTIACTGTPAGGSLVSVEPLPPGGPCIEGGTIIRTGLDDNGDGILGFEEVDSETFVCNGESAIDDSTTCEGSPFGIEGTLVVLDETSLLPIEGVTCIDGTVIVNSGTLDSLEGLGALQKITGDLLIVGNVSLQSLEGLRSLTSVGGTLIVQNNDLLQDLRGLETLRRFDQLRIIGNEALAALHGLEGIESIGGNIEINAVPNLARLTGLENLKQLRDLRIQNNDALVELSSLANLSRTTGNVIFTGNDLLTSIELPSVQRIDGVFDVFEHEAVSTVTLPSMFLMGGQIRVRDNVALRETSFPSLATADGLVYTGNAALERIAYDALIYVSGTIEIARNPAFARLDLPMLTTIGGIFVLAENDSLPNFQGMDSLETITTRLSVRANDAMVDFSGLERLSSISGDLKILQNADLLSLTGFTSLSRISGVLEIQDNPVLPTSAAEALSRQIEVGDAVIIDGNGPG